MYKIYTRACLSFQHLTTSDCGLVLNEFYSEDFRTFCRETPVILVTVIGSTRNLLPFVL